MNLKRIGLDFFEEASHSYSKPTMKLGAVPGSLAASQGVFLAKDYQDHSDLQWKWSMESLKKFPFNENDKVLDVGCGDGRITAWIAKQVPNGAVIGLDISKNMIVHASSNHSNDNLLFLQGDAKLLQFEEKFDKIVSFCALHWVVEQEQALRSFKNGLKPGGALLLIIPGKISTNFGTVSEKIARSEKWCSYFPNFKQPRIYYTPEEYKLLLEKIKFSIQSIEVSETITKYADKTDLIAHTRPVANFIDHLSPTLQDDFIDDVLTKQILESDLVFPDGSIGLKTVKIEVMSLNLNSDF